MSKPPTTLERLIKHRNDWQNDAEIYAQVCSAIALTRMAGDDPAEFQADGNATHTVISAWGEAQVGGAMVRNRSDKPIRVTVEDAA